MSGAAGQAFRAGTRESAGNGSSNPSNVVAASNAPSIPSLEPDGESIKALLQGQKVVDKNTKYDVVNRVFETRVPVQQSLENARAGSSTGFQAITWDSNTSGTKMKAKSAYSASFLGGLIYDICQGIRPILPTSTNFAGLSTTLKNAITPIHQHYEMAYHSAANDLNAKFSNQFYILRGAAYDRKYLQNGDVFHDGPPGNASNLSGGGSNTCLCCTHGFCDNRHSNQLVVASNLALRQGHDRQLAVDAQRTAQKLPLLTATGAVMQEGRKRQEPKYGIVVNECHCQQFHCDTREGVVNKRLCPIQCIDVSTGQRFGFDLNGDCLCPICRCNCRRAYSTTAIQMYTANRMVSENGGQANLANPPATRHRPPVSVVGNYHATASSMSAIMHRHGHSAVQGALAAARNDIQAGLSVDRLDMAMAGEQMAVLAGREMAETMHGDSASARTLSQVAAAAGPPTSFTNLPRNGRMFNTRDIPTSSRNHRQSNNRLDPMTVNDGRRVQRSSMTGTRSVLFPDGVNQGPTGAAPPPAGRRSGTAAATAAAAAGSSTTLSAPGAAAMRRAAGSSSPGSRTAAAATSTSSAAAFAAAAEDAQLAAREQRHVEMAMEESLADETERSARVEAEEKRLMERAKEASLESFSTTGGQKRAAAPRPPPAKTPPTAPGGSVVTQTQRKKPARGNQKPPTEREIQERLLGAVDNTLNSFGQKPPPAGLPSCLDGVDTSMFTDEAASTTPIPSGKSNNPDNVVDLNTPEEDVEADLAETEDLVSRCFQRSFDDAMAESPPGAATQRVRAFTDKPAAVRMLIEGYRGSAAMRGKDMESPAVNRMLDKFL